MSAYKTYWRAYGGIVSLLRSPYLVLSFIFSFATNPIWYHESGGRTTDLWPSIAISILPGLTAFSIGAIAIFIALSRGLFLAAMQEGGERSFFLKVVSAFFHFVMVQLSALLAAIVFLAYPSNATSFIAYLLFTYSIFSGLAAAAILVDVAEIKNEADPLEGDGGSAACPTPPCHPRESGDPSDPSPQ